MKSGGFLRKLGFTPNEQKVIYFLLLTLCIGGGIKLYYIISGNGTPPRFDYRAADREFEERSHTRALVDSIDRSTEIKTLPVSRIRSTQKKAPPSGSVDLNSASRTELVALPGIGSTMAERIVLYRKEHGRFASNEELMNVKGIGKIKFQKLKPYLRQP
jgi:comEA protein